ncbi:MAG TPA: UDP-N-acetylmuramoyl-tripeptide--D-alanyl-D-alanine ligase [Neisseriales bacterium]|jgi:UDP-N-acetylmuramoyl-tripeptide--D-alanyl-D-alanine ligase|nr:UDP-N-acetylmuramoyl-tripeptide--D-alanyl-D-alanine ligase [Neisseriales bacterium]
MNQLTGEELIKLSGGIAANQFNFTQSVTKVTLDSRKTALGKCLFVAIRGENNDGHDYVRQVVSNPTNFALVALDFSEDLPNLIRVADTTLGLGSLAANYRQLFDIPVVAITGSNGKTTVKEMLRSVCQSYFGVDQVLATGGNLNNHWGMPLTLLELETKHSVAIIEIGMNHSGELNYLTHLAKPTVAVVNNVMFAHAGHFTSLAEIAAAKGEIYHGLDATGVACVDSSSQFSQKWLCNDIKSKIFSYGSPATQCFIKTLSAEHALYQTPEGELMVQLKVLGAHNYYNALTVIALALNLGCSLAAIKLGLENYAGYKGRLERKSAFNGALIIDDTYNANPDSVKAALAAIQNLPQPHWFIFADLKELGEHELEFHREIGEAANLSGVEHLITVGKLAKHAAQFFTGDKINFENNADVVKYCLSCLPPKATLLIKGSNSMNLAEVASQLTALKTTL